MKSRLAVSLLFILIASTFASDATAAFKKLRSWTGKVWGRCAVQVCNRLTPRDSALVSAIRGSDKDGVTMIHLAGDRLLLGENCATANQARVVGTISPDGKTITLNSPEATKLLSSQEGDTPGVVFKLVGSDYHSEAFEFITTAAGQIRDVLGLTRLK
jgi:hypothetical protein